MSKGKESQTISTRLSTDAYHSVFDLCSGRECTASELIAMLLYKALESGDAERIVTEVEALKMKALKKLDPKILQAKLRAAERSAALLSAALNNGK